MIEFSHPGSAYPFSIRYYSSSAGSIFTSSIGVASSFTEVLVTNTSFFVDSLSNYLGLILTIASFHITIRGLTFIIMR